MSNQLKMADIQCILTLRERGWSRRRIARELGIDRQTVGRHLRLSVSTACDGGVVQPKPATAQGIALTGSPMLDRVVTDSTPAIADIALIGSAEHPSDEKDSKPANPDNALTGSDANFGAALTEVKPAAPGSPSRCEPWRAIIAQKLEAGFSAQRIYQDLAGEHGYPGSYHSVRRMVGKLSSNRPLPWRRMECEPGAEGQVDFGRGAPVIASDGKRKATWVFRIVLSYSRKGYSEAVHRQSTDDFLRSLENAFAHFGGVPRTLVIDNLRAAVKRADWFDPELCPKVRSFAEHYGTAILPTRPYLPRHKGKIERGIGYVKGNALKGRTFDSLAAQNQHLQTWESTVADTRIHGTTRKQVKELFEKAEKSALLPLPTARFELFQEALRSVHRDGHVDIKGAYYSVPAEFLGQRIWARWDGRTVRLLDHKMRLIALHVQRQPGTFSTLDVHILPEKISGIERGTTWLLQRVQSIGPQSTQWAQSMLQHRGIEGVRVLMGLLSLTHKHRREQIEQACQVALSHDAYHLRSLRQLIEHHAPPEIQQSLEFVQEHPIIRGLGDYGQFVRQAITQSSLAEGKASASESIA
jgi:transposase